MAMEALTLVSNPGSASRKYALFAGKKVRAELHFEYIAKHVVCTLTQGDKQLELHPGIRTIEDAAEEVVGMLKQSNMLHPGEEIARIGLRIVAPGTFFTTDHIINDDVENKLAATEPRAPLHIKATLAELRALRKHFSNAPIAGISDSAFHAAKPEVARYYGMSLDDAQQYDIMRFGYHGISLASVAATLQAQNRLAEKTVVCHLGSGSSVTALFGGKSVDTTMGYSPLEGLVMATRAGNVDITAARAIKDSRGFTDDELDEYLNKKSGLLGISGTSSDIRELLKHEQTQQRARLALGMYVYTVQKAIGQMVAALGGIDLLVFTGTVGERSAPMRERIVKKFEYLDFIIDASTNAATTNPSEPTNIGLIAHSRPLWVVPTDEAAQIALRVQQIVS